MADAPVHGRLTVGVTETRIDVDGANFWDGVIANRSASSIYIGKTGVTTTTGFELSAGQSMELRVAGTGRPWYAIAAGAGNRLDYAAVVG